MPAGPRLWEEKDLCFVHCFAALSVMRAYNADHGSCFWSLDSTLTPHVGSDEINGGMNKWQIFTATTRRDSWQRWRWYAPVRRSCCCEWLRSQYKKVCVEQPRPSRYSIVIQLGYLCFDAQALWPEVGTSSDTTCMCLVISLWSSELVISASTLMMHSS
jgi:hypothetical protein